VGKGCSPPTKGGVLEGQFFCFVISKWHILVNSEVLNLKFFFSVSSLNGVRVDSVAIKFRSLELFLCIGLSKMPRRKHGLFLDSSIA